MPSDPFGNLGQFLTATEATAIAAQLLAGQLTSAALREVNPARREDAKRLLAAAGVGHADLALSIAVLHSVAGAKAARRNVTPVWTMPGNEAEIGKPQGSDERHGKATYVSVHGLERAQELARESHANARAALAEASGRTERLGGIADYVLTRSA